MSWSMGRWLMIPALGLLAGVVATAGETPVKPEWPRVFEPESRGGAPGQVARTSDENVKDTAAKPAPSTPTAGAEPGIRLPTAAPSPVQAEPAMQTARSGDAKPSPGKTSALNDAMGANVDGVRLAPLTEPPPGVITKENGAPAEDYRRPKYYAVTRPVDKPLRVGRLFGSCSCIKVEAMTPTALAAGKDGQVVLRVRIVKEPPAGVELLMVTAQVTQPSEDILTILMNPLE